MKTQDIKNIARAMQQVSELTGGQHKLDKDKDGDIDGKDFAMMRKKKKSMGEEEVEINPTLKTKKEKKGIETTTQDMGEEVEQVDEISKKTLGSYIKKAGPDAVKQTAQAKRHSDAGDMADKDRDMYKAYGKSQRSMDKAKNREKGISKAVDKLTASYKTESKNAALMKKLAKASAPSEKGKKAVSLPKAPFEIPGKNLNKESSAYYTQTVAKHLAKKDGHDYSKLPVYHVGKPHQQGYAKKAKDALDRGEYKRGIHDSTEKEGVEWAVYNKIKENRAAHYKSATAPEEMDSKASGNEKDFKAKHKVDTMPADLEKKGHDDASAAGRVTKKAPARNGDNAAGDKIKMAVDTTKG